MPLPRRAPHPTSVPPVPPAEELLFLLIPSETPAGEQGRPHGEKTTFKTMQLMMRNNIREQSRTIREKQGSCKELTATCEDRTQRLSSAEQLVSASVASQPRFLNPSGEPQSGQVLAHHTGPQGTPLSCPYPLMTAEYVLHLGTWWKDVIRPHCCSVYPFTFEMSMLDLDLHGILDERGLCSYWY